MQHAPTVLINGRPKANRRATPRVSVSRGRWHRPALSPRSRGWAVRFRGLHDQASVRGEVKDTPPRCSASQDPMMNMGSRGIIAAVLDNDSDSDTEASKRYDNTYKQCSMRVNGPALDSSCEQNQSNLALMELTGTGTYAHDYARASPSPSLSLLLRLSDKWEGGGGGGVKQRILSYHMTPVTQVIGHRQQHCSAALQHCLFTDIALFAGHLTLPSPWPRLAVPTPLGPVL